MHLGTGTCTRPGHDPKESWDLGNFYRLEPRTESGTSIEISERDSYLRYGFVWKKPLCRTRTEKQPGVIVMSRDQGKSWSEAGGAGVASSSFLSRIRWPFVRCRGDPRPAQRAC